MSSIPSIRTTTEDGVELRPLYEPLGGTPEKIGRPGEYPFTRGIHQSMYRGRMWTMRQYAGFGDATDSNERYRNLIEQGQNGISVAFDLPTQLGYDSDDPVAMPEVGRVGVALDTLDDLRRLLDGIDVENASPSFNINAPACVLIAMYAALIRQRGGDTQKIRGTFQNDIFKEFLSRGTYIFPPAASLKLFGDTVEFCAKEMPRVYPVSVSGGHIRDTGCDGLLAWAISIADGIEYLREAARRGLDVVKIASRFSFLYNSRMDFFVEAAQFRAMRRLWARLMKEEFGITDPDACKFRFFSGTSNMTFTRQEPLNNVIRATLQALGVILGGGQAVTVIGYDEPYDIPSEEAQLLALRTQQIIAYETSIPATVDPLGGSYYVEELTDEFEERMRAHLGEIQERGGIVAAIEDGWIQERFYDNAYELEKGSAGGEVPVVGVTVFTKEDEKDHGEDKVFGMVGPLHQVDDATAERQAARLADHRASRDNGLVEKLVESVRLAATADENVVFPMVDAVQAGATLGELVGALKSVYGTYQEGGRV